MEINLPEWLVKRSVDNVSKTRKQNTMKGRLKAFKQRDRDIAKALIHLLIGKVQGRAINLESSIFPLPLHSTSVQPPLLPERDNESQTPGLR